VVYSCGRALAEPETGQWTVDMIALPAADSYDADSRPVLT